MKLYQFLTALLFTIGLAFAFSSGASAQEPTPPSDDQVNAIARNMYCPVCENIPLDVCPTTACIQWREVIRAKLAEGWDEQQIRDYFAVSYGDRVLSEPPRRGLNWLVYVLPPLVVVAGLIIVTLVLRGMRPRNTPAAGQPAEQAPGPQASDEYVRRLEEELKRKQ